MGYVRLPDPRPEPRLVDPQALPLDELPLAEETCPLCGQWCEKFQRLHVVARSQGGDDVPENLVYGCAACHGKLPPQGTDRKTAELFVAYVKLLGQPYLAYIASKKWPGYLEDRYLGVRV